MPERPLFRKTLLVVTRGAVARASVLPPERDFDESVLDHQGPTSGASPNETTRDPAHIPREVAGSSCRFPVIPASHVAKVLRMPEIPAHSRSARNHQDRPVTPEVAGSSPVAPVENSLENHLFCCHVRKRHRVLERQTIKTGRT